MDFVDTLRRIVRDIEFDSNGNVKEEVAAESNVADTNNDINNRYLIYIDKTI